MDKSIFKERFEYIIGFLALTVSLSNFKDELKSITISTPLLTFNLAQYFLTVILASLVALHFYFIPQFVSSKKKVIIKFNNFLTYVCFAILFFIILTPFFIGIVYLLNLIHFPKVQFGENFKIVLQGIAVTLFSGLTLYFSISYAGKSDHIIKMSVEEYEQLPIKKYGLGITLEQYFQYRQNEMLETWEQGYHRLKKKYIDKKTEKNSQPPSQPSL
jgi:hypothetical protein